jgi:hypothetical protein
MKKPFNNRYTMYYYLSRKLFLKHGVDIEKINQWEYSIYNKTLHEWGLSFE